MLHGTEAGSMVVDRNEFRSLMQVTYRFAYQGPSPFEKNSPLLEEFVEHIYTKKGNSENSENSDVLTLDDLKKMLAEQPLLENLWAEFKKNEDSELEKKTPIEDKTPKGDETPIEDETPMESETPKGNETPMDEASSLAE